MAAAAAAAVSVRAREGAPCAAAGAALQLPPPPLTLGPAEAKRCCLTGGGPGLGPGGGSQERVVQLHLGLRAAAQARPGHPSSSSLPGRPAVSGTADKRRSLPSAPGRAGPRRSHEGPPPYPQRPDGRLPWGKEVQHGGSLLARQKQAPGPPPPLVGASSTCLSLILTSLLQVRSLFSW